MLATNAAPHSFTSGVLRPLFPGSRVLLPERLVGAGVQGFDAAVGATVSVFNASDRPGWQSRTARRTPETKHVAAAELVHDQHAVNRRSLALATASHGAAGGIGSGKRAAARARPASSCVAPLCWRAAPRRAPWHGRENRGGGERHLRGPGETFLRRSMDQHQQQTMPPDREQTRWQGLASVGCVNRGSRSR